MSRKVRHPSGISHAELRQMLHYDQSTGLFTWLVNRRAGARVGDQAGCIKERGGQRYFVIYLFGREYGAHRLAVFYMNGAMPLSGVDHADGDGTNNKWSNLRAATLSQNAANSKLNSANSSGRKGVTWHRQCRRWQAGIKKHGKSYYLGLFDSVEEAHAAYMAKAKELFGEFARAA